MDQALHEGFIQFGISVQGHHDIGIDHAGEGSRIGALTAAHIAVVVDCIVKHLLDEPMLAQTEGLHGFEGLTLARGEPHGKIEAVKARVLAGETEISTGHSVQRSGDIVPVIRGFGQLVQEWVEVFFQQAVQQAALTAEVVVQGRLLMPAASLIACTPTPS